MRRMQRCFLASMLASFLLIGTASAAVTTEWTIGTNATLLSTELNSIGPNGFTVASAFFDNTIGQPGNGYTMCRVEAVVSFGAAPAATSSLTVWFLKTSDNVNYENTPNGTILLNRPPDAVLPITTGLTTPWTTRVSMDVFCPAGRFKAVAQNNGTGQTTAASGNLLRLLSISPQGN